MTSWWSSKPLDEQIARATSESLPSGTEDMFQSLEIADQVRSKAVAPKEAMRALKRRINHKNPNVQLAALKLTDTCVKNGGDHFLIEVASREFMDNLVSLLKSPNGINFDVKTKILEEIQTWALAFEGRPHLSYVKTIFNKLKSEGFQFTDVAPVNANFVDSSAPPEWADSDRCMRCHTPFTLTNRKHHCRNCGNVFCGDCSSKSMPLPHLGIVQPVRVCETCFEERSNPKSTKPSLNQEPTPNFKSAQAKSMQPRSARVEEDDDRDLRLALQMSLEEAKRAAKPAVESPVTQRLPRVPEERGKEPNPEDEDPDLKAAIAASLRDMEQQKAAKAAETPAVQSYEPASKEPSLASYSAPAHELSPIEAENITLFATLIERMQSSPPGTILREPKIQELYEAVTALKPKLGRSLSTVVGTYETLVDMHAKLNTVVRYYDKMLEDRLATAYSHATYQEPRDSLQASPGYQYNPPPQSPGSPYQQRHDYFPSSRPPNDDNRQPNSEISYGSAPSYYQNERPPPPANQGIARNNIPPTQHSSTPNANRRPSAYQGDGYQNRNESWAAPQEIQGQQTSASRDRYPSYNESNAYYQQQSLPRREEASLIDL